MARGPKEKFNWRSGQGKKESTGAQAKEKIQLARRPRKKKEPTGAQAKGLCECAQAASKYQIHLNSKLKRVARRPWRAGLHKNS
jgi:N-acetyl-beta-hexosaminidase